MKDYRIQSSEVRGDKLTITLVANTPCGHVTAKATVKAGKRETLQQLEQAATDAAVRNLAYEYEDAVLRCVTRGKHSKAHEL